MTTTFKPKLVRNRIPEIIRENGQRPIFVNLRDPEQIRFYLMQKLIEEATEVDGATTEAEILEELADMHEVMRAIADLHGVRISSAIEAANVKRKKRGGFSDGVLLLSVDDANRFE